MIIDDDENQEVICLCFYVPSAHMIFMRVNFDTGPGICCVKVAKYRVCRKTRLVDWRDYPSIIPLGLELQCIQQVFLEEGGRQKSFTSIPGASGLLTGGKYVMWCVHSITALCVYKQLFTLQIHKAHACFECHGSVRFNGSQDLACACFLSPVLSCVCGRVFAIVTPSTI